MPIYYLTISLYPFSFELGYRQLFVFIYDGLRLTVYVYARDKEMANSMGKLADEKDPYFHPSKTSLPTTLLPPSALR